MKNGFSLIEVLIASFILTFGLLGITGLCISSLKRTEDAYWRTIATSQLMAMAELQKNDCEDLLPHGECTYEAQKITICWDKKDGKQCL